jgi:hypothetical protein
VGVKSTALLFDDRAPAILRRFNYAFLACLISAGVMNDHGMAFYAASALSALQVHRSIKQSVDGVESIQELLKQSPPPQLQEAIRSRYWRGFVDCGHAGWILSGGIFVDCLLKTF